MIKCFERSTVERIEENSNDVSRCLFMYRSIPKPPIPPPRANPRAFDFFEKFWSNSPLCCQIRRKNAPPIRASKRVKSPTLQGKKNRLPLEINRIAYLLNKFCKFSATTNFLFSLSSLHALNKDIFHDITI